jgi:hypothetical protein
MLWRTAVRWRYSDRHGNFRVNAKEATTGDGKTEFGRVAERLGIVVIHARTPQAKGRVERANQRLQDRLVKEMQLRNIASMEAANAFSPIFIASFKQRFAGPPRDDASAFRPWTDTPEAFDTALARREERVLSKALTFTGNDALCKHRGGSPRDRLKAAPHHRRFRIEL